MLLIINKHLYSHMITIWKVVAECISSLWQIQPVQVCRLGNQVLMIIFIHRFSNWQTKKNEKKRQNLTNLTNTHTHTHPFNGPLSGTTQVSRYHKGKTNLDFTKARDSEWQWHQLGRMQVCTSLQTDNHTSTQPLSFLQAGCLSCRPTNSIKALKG